MYSVAHKRELLWVPRDEIYDLEKVKGKYTFTPKYSNLEPVPAFEVNDDFFGFPRHSLIEAARRSDGTFPGKAVSVRFLGTLRGPQISVVEEFVESMMEGEYDLILEADSGSGKTVMLLNMWAELKCTALVVVPKTDLINQWRDKILKFTDLPSDRIGIARQGVCEYEGKSIVLGMVHSLCKDRYPQGFKDHFGLVIFDELHKLGAFYFSKVAGMFPARYRIGATATLKRSDGMEEVFLSHLGRRTIRPKKSTQPIPRIIVYSYPFTSGRIPGYLTEAIMRRGSLFTMLARNSHRTRILAQLIKQVIDSDRQTLVVSERTEHLRKLKKILQEFGYAESKLGLYLGRTSDKERERVSKECICILATTSMLSLGTDIPTLRGIVFATPVSYVEQPIGRICREGETIEPVVIDFLDIEYPEAMRWYQTRQKFYNSKRCEVVPVSG